jgi:hypothetical protein
MWDWIKQLDRILRGEATRTAALREGTIEVPAAGLCVVVFALAVIFGLCMGVFAVFRPVEPSYMQMLASALKVPALFFLTLAITFPSLYVFNALVGSRLNIVAVARLLIASLAVNVAVLASLGPILAFFSFSTTSYSFMVLLNVLLFAAAGGLGLAFLLQTLHRLTVAPREPLPPVAQPVASEVVPAVPAMPAIPTVPGVFDAPIAADAGPAVPPRFVVPQLVEEPSALERLEGRVFGRQVKVVFNCWVVIFGLVGAQMGWVLRPFIGAPGTPFTWFRERESNFFEAVFTTLLNLFR